MKITLTITAAGTPQTVIALGDDAAGAYISEFHVSGEQMTQDNPLPAAAGLQHFARGNVNTELDWKVSRTFATRDQALLFAGVHAQQSLQTGTLTLADANNANVQWGGAVLRRVEVVEDAFLTLVHRYTALAGSCASALPTRPFFVM